MRAVSPQAVAVGNQGCHRLFVSLAPDPIIPMDIGPSFKTLQEKPSFSPQETPESRKLDNACKHVHPSNHSHRCGGQPMTMSCRGSRPAASTPGGPRGEHCRVWAGNKTVSARSSLAPAVLGERSAAHSAYQMIR
jgi:hypothetical protein